jgi:hypothetical protein
LMETWHGALCIGKQALPAGHSQPDFCICDNGGCGCGRTLARQAPRRAAPTFLP